MNVQASPLLSTQVRKKCPAHLRERDSNIRDETQKVKKLESVQTSFLDNLWAPKMYLSTASFFFFFFNNFRFAAET